MVITQEGGWLILLDNFARMDKIKVGFCVAYDWELLRHSLPLVYADADIICLSIDKKRRSWAGASYQWNSESFQNFIQSIDTKKKIK